MVEQGVEIKVEEKGLKPVMNILGSMAVRGKDIRPMMKNIGHIMVGGVMENFEQGGRPKWKERKDYTNAARGQKAVDRYFNNTKRGQQLFLNASAGKKRSMAAFERTRSSLFERATGGIVLNDSGRLKQSITMSADNSQVMVGSNLIYARIHQFGGIIKPKRSNALCIPIGGDRIVQVKKVEIPARPYLTITNKENSEIVNEAKEYIMEAYNENR